VNAENDIQLMAVILRHLKEDMGDWIVEDGKELSPEEMEFHYFK